MGTEDLAVLSLRGRLSIREAYKSMLFARSSSIFMAARLQSDVNAPEACSQSQAIQAVAARLTGQAAWRVSLPPSNEERSHAMSISRKRKIKIASYSE